jgi:hypothetical protein
VIVHDLDLHRAFIRPNKAHPELVVDPDRVLPLAIAEKYVQTICSSLSVKRNSPQALSYLTRRLDWRPARLVLGVFIRGNDELALDHRALKRARVGVKRHAVLPDATRRFNSICTKYVPVRIIFLATA